MSKNMENKKGPRVEFSRTSSLRLPTPPPDPVQTDKPPDDLEQQCESALKATIDKENEFLEYLNSLPSPNKGVQTDKPILQRTGSIFAPAMATEDAFDHLDKLYKLMEQLLNLREQNARLQRRVRDLEYLKNLQNMDQKVTSSVLRGEEGDIPELDDDSVLAEALLDNMFTSTRNKRSTKYKSPSQFRFRQSILRPQRDRSSSLAVDSALEDKNTLIPRNNSGKSLFEQGITRKPSKVSKWTKVKAAFKWEKASPTVTGAKSQDSGIGGMLPVNNEIAKYLRVPSTCDNPTDAGTSPADSVLSGSWQGVHGLSTPGTLSPASSTDELNPSTNSDHRSVSRTESAGNSNISGIRFRTSRTSEEEEEGDRRSRSLDYTGSYSCDSSQPISKDELIKLHSSKAHKTPWGKVKDIIQIRKDSLKKKQYRLSTRSDDYRTDCSAGSDQEDVFEPPLIALNSNCSEQLSEDIRTPTVTVTVSEDITSNTIKQKPSHLILYNDDIHKIPPDVVARYKRVAAEEDKIQSKTNPESPRSQRRISKWTKVKKAFLTSSRNDYSSKSTPSSPTNKHSHFFTDFHWKTYDMCDKPYHNKRTNDDLESRKLKEEIHKNYELLQKKLSLEFQEKLHEWEKVKSNITAVGNTAGSSQGAGACGSTTDDQRDPEFARKIEEWERIKKQNLESTKGKSIQMTSEENLPPEFRKKLQEWQKIKKFGGKEETVGSSNSRKKKTEWQLWRSNSSNKQDNSMSLVQPEGRQYSEDFLKKLDEWKQIKSSHGTSDDHDHRKSLKETKPPSPGVARKTASNKLMRQSKKHKMQEWLEKELQKIEKEKQRLEREREKFLEREERLAKLRRSIGNGQNKKDVLVQTSTGFYRFEGISRKFTQKLYEWEKARGIGPEDSTFALLNSGYNQICPNPITTNQGTLYRHKPMRTVKLTRSKSVDSVANLTCGGPLITHQPSSLSLNDVEELEMQCLAASSSDRNLQEESEDNADYEEPEAVIVEVEDFVEETAAPLVAGIKDNHQTPVYHTEVIKLCESEKCEAPQVRRSDSARALSNYNLIQESLNILNKIRDTEETCKATEAKLNETTIQTKELSKNTGAIPKRKRNDNLADRQNTSSLQNNLNTYYLQQSEMSQGLANKILLLQDANVNASKDSTSENTGYTISHLGDTLSITQDISAELVTMSEKLKTVLSERQNEFKSGQENNINTNKKYEQNICEMVNLLIQKIKELKRSLSYLCAASDMTAPGRRKKGSYKNRKSSFKKRASLDQIAVDKAGINDTSDEDDNKKDKTKCPRRKEKLVKSKSEDNQIINYAKIQVTSTSDNTKNRAERSYQLNRLSNSQSQSQLGNLKNTSEAEDFKRKMQTNDSGTSEKDSPRREELFRKNRQRKLIRTKRISDSSSDVNKEFEDDTKSEEDKRVKQNENSPPITNSNVIIPTNIQYVDATSPNSNVNENISASPVSVFVHTTRKLFTPFASEAFETRNETQTNNNSNEQTSTLIPDDDADNKQNEPTVESLLVKPKKQITINAIPQEIINTTENLQTHENTETILPENQNSRPTTPSYLPPLPNSPIAQRRERHLTKETSPAIRLMIARYNQKLSEQENAGNKSAGSSGSASPVAWRSPVFERRVKAQTEKYQEEVNKTLFTNPGRYSPLFMRKMVQKSASIGVIHPIVKQATSPETAQRGISFDSSDQNASPKLIRGILKSTSMGSMKPNQNCETIQASNDDKIQTTTIIPQKLLEKPPSLKLSIPLPEIDSNSFEMSPVLQERAHKLQKAKEDFLSQNADTPVGEPSSAPIFNKEDNPVKYPTRNRLSQVSFGSESSCDDYSGLLVKSASAGMINIDEVTYQQFVPEMHSQGYVSLPRATKKKDGKFGISSLASKFRKVKMRRSKDPSQMNTISTLCRQSLVVDITANSQENLSDNVDNKNKIEKRRSSSDIHSPSTSKTSWIKNPSKLFKPK